jgi:uncharacterized protein (DUF4415 family)
MRKEYDLKKMKLKPNPYASMLKKSITIRLDADVVEYFKNLGDNLGIPYQTLLNEYLKNCKDQKLVPKTTWIKAA